MVGAALKVLIVEDEVMIAEYFQRVTEADGLDVTVVHDVQHAMNYLDGQCPDLVLLDLRLGSGSGEDVLDMLHRHEHCVQPRVIVTTANPERAASLMGKVDLIMTKPVRMAQLREEISRLLGVR